MTAPPVHPDRAARPVAVPVDKVDGEGVLERRVKLAASVLAPTTVLTALLFYYGYVCTNTEYAYFGLGLSTLGLSNQDFLLRSVAALYLPLGALLFTLLVAVWGHAAVQRLLSDQRHRKALRVGALSAGGLGAVALVRGVVGLLVPDVSRDEPLALSPLCLGVGICALAYARYLRYTLDPPSTAGGGWLEQVSTAVVAALVVLSLFWAANSFAGAYGRGAAILTARQLTDRPAVVLDTKERLFVRFPGIAETALPVDRGSSFRFRYRGLRLLVESGGRLFLVPALWRPGQGATIVVPDDSTVRLQFYRG